MIKRILQVEGLVFFILIMLWYFNVSGNWLLFILLLFVPDISMLGYLKDKTLGAIAYNAGHNYILAVIIMFFGFATGIAFIYEVGMILFAHVSMDRMLGFGLKYQTNFKDTHLERV